MKYELDGMLYQIEIVRKNNRNTYLRIREPNIIYVTTNYFTTKKQIMKMIQENESSLTKIAKQVLKEQNTSNDFYYLGSIYDIIMVPTLKEIKIVDNNIYAASQKELDKFLLKKANELFQQRLDYYYNIMEEDIPYPKLKLRKMKTRWGVCNKRNNTITLNTELIHYPLVCTDYVVVHELSHFTHFNHSKEFWKLVEKYCKNYKKIKKMLKG